MVDEESSDIMRRIEELASSRSTDLLLREAAQRIAEQAIEIAPVAFREVLAEVRQSQIGADASERKYRVALKRFTKTPGFETPEARTAIAAVVTACWAIDDPNFRRPSPGSLAVAAEYLGQLRAMITPSSEWGELADRTTSDVMRAVGQKGGKVRGARYAALAEKVREAYAKWNTGVLKIPNARKGRRRLEDFDAWAAQEFDLSMRSVSNYRPSKKRKVALPF